MEPAKDQPGKTDNRFCVRCADLIFYIDAPMKRDNNDPGSTFPKR